MVSLVVSIASLCVFADVIEPAESHRRYGLPTTAFSPTNHDYVRWRGGASVVEPAGSDVDRDDEIDKESDGNYAADKPENDDDSSQKPSSSLKDSTLRSSRKAEARKTALADKEAKNVLKKELSVKEKRTLLRLPYVLRALLNPVTFFAMTKAYWLSFFDFDYVQKNSNAAQDLRSALQTRAKKSGGGSGLPKRRMTRGQAKTLSDLPALSS